LFNVEIVQLGGNNNFRAFLNSYEPAADGGYREGMGAYELYHSWAATQWREKVFFQFSGG
jgi:ADP-ribosylation factor GTPase-activating protein 1